MKIELTRSYLSIGELECPELPDFTVLIGQNGAGKTHFLQALHARHAVVSGIGENSIELHDLASFQPNAGSGGHASIDLAKSTAQRYLESQCLDKCFSQSSCRIIGVRSLSPGRSVCRIFDCCKNKLDVLLLAEFSRHLRSAVRWDSALQ